MATHWKIHKFGGSSLSDAACFQRVANILAGEQKASPGTRLGVVVSAMYGMTDDLYKLSMLAEGDDRAYVEKLQLIGERYSSAAGELLDGDALISVLDAWSEDSRTILDHLAGIARVRSAPQQARDVVAGFGEIWSARLLAAYLGKLLGPQHAGEWVDARRILVVRHGELGPLVLWDASQEKFDQRIARDFDGVAVITGFNAADEQGLPTTLGRNGSDYSAAIFAALAQADSLTIWTDVDGVLSGDPRRIPEAQVIGALSYNEAMELAYFGAKVIHPQTMGPAIANGIPIRIRNTFSPESAGSKISSRSEADAGIKGITSIDDIAIVNVEGAGMIGVPGTADRLFAALKKADVSVTLISQASSEHSICIAVPRALAERAQQVIADAFADELAGGQIQNVDVSSDHSIVAVVGDNMAGMPGVAARFFGTLGNAGINVRAIAQGSSERNISAVVATAESTRALRAVHSGFYLSAKTLSIGLLGPGNVGGALLDQISRRSDWLLERFNLDLRIRAIARSSGMLLGKRAIQLPDWRSDYKKSAVAFEFDGFESHVHADHLPHAVIIDCTSSDEVANQYASWLSRGIHVITPNKKAFSGPGDYHASLGSAAERGNSHYYYETTVGAALPIISTLRNLLDTGDRVRSIDGILSGTLAYLFNVYDGSRPFSDIVREARDSGYTEPDPRDDLSGMDVARKLTILARELGMAVEIGDFPVQNLIPEDLRDVETEEFLRQLPRYDAQMLDLYKEADAAGKRLRYVAELNDQGELSVGLRQVEQSSALSHVALTDNIVRFSSDRYASNPLVVQGPGAGPEVTAGGVFGDLLNLARHLGGN